MPGLCWFQASTMPQQRTRRRWLTAAQPSQLISGLTALCPPLCALARSALHPSDNLFRPLPHYGGGWCKRVRRLQALFAAACSPGWRPPWLCRWRRSRRPECRTAASQWLSSIALLACAHSFAFCPVPLCPCHVRLGCSACVLVYAAGISEPPALALSCSLSMISSWLPCATPPRPPATPHCNR